MTVPKPDAPDVMVVVEAPATGPAVVIPAAMPDPKPLPPPPVIVTPPLSAAIPVAAPGTITAKDSATPEFSRWRQRWVSFWWVIGMPLDLIDLKTGLPDHDRLVSLSVGMGLGYKILTEKGYPPLGITALGISAMFGVRVFKLWLNRSKFTVDAEERRLETHETQEIHVTEELIQRPTPDAETMADRD